MLKTPWYTADAQSLALNMESAFGSTFFISLAEFLLFPMYANLEITLIIGESK